MNDLVTDLSYLLRKIDKAIDTLAKNGQQAAKAEMEYRIALAQEILILRDKGQPVTIIGDLARGNSKIASLKFNRDTSQAVYEANLEAIQSWKLQARLMDSQIAREWGRKGEQRYERD